MGLVKLNLDRRMFLKVGSMAFAAPLLMKASGVFSLATANAATAAAKVTDTYNKAIDKMVEGTRKRMAKAVGWGSGKTATAQDLISNASSSVSYNPFWINESYAAGTRWGSLIAYPMYSTGGNMITTVESETPDCGFDSQLWPGQDWEFFQPIRLNDTVRAWNKLPQLIEQKVDRGGIRGFLNIEGDYDMINQKNEIVTSTKNYTVRIFYPGGVPGAKYTLTRYGFSEAEILYLDKLARQTAVRGAEIRYWEDVKVGDMLNPIVVGPTNFQDIANQGGGGAAPGGTGTGASIPGMGGSMGGGRGAVEEEKKPVAQLLAKEGVIGSREYVKDNTTGYYYKGGGDTLRHWDDYGARIEGEPGAFLWGLISIKSMIRCVTNWMGNDAFVRKYSWRHVTRTMVGDAAFSLGKVINKRNENGEYLVDIFVYHQDMRGYIGDAAVATVALLSKTKTYPDFKKVINY
jgi:acyl dehydratase